MMWNIHPVMRSGKKAQFGESKRLLNAADSHVRETHLKVYGKRRSEEYNEKGGAGTAQKTNKYDTK